MSTEVEWMTPQGEYRPTEYLQSWLSFWFNDEKRLAAAKVLQQSRITYLQKVWQSSRELQNEGFVYQDSTIQSALKAFHNRTISAQDTQELLLTEAQLTKTLYKYAANNTGQKNFTRQHQAVDKANSFLNHGNYLAYGLAASCLWVLGIPHGFAVMHGKTRRGALVFDIADLIKDAVVLPWAFICGKEGATEQEFRQQILQSFVDHQSLDFMFDVVKSLALQQNEAQQQVTQL